MPDETIPEVTPEAPGSVNDESAAYQVEYTQQELLAAQKPFKTPGK